VRNYWFLFVVHPYKIVTCCIEFKFSQLYTVLYPFFTPPSGRGLVIPFFLSCSPLLLFIFFSWSLTPDFWFSLGQTNIRCKLLLHHLGSYLEQPWYILHPEGREHNSGVLCPWGFSCFNIRGPGDCEKRTPKDTSKPQVKKSEIGTTTISSYKSPQQNSLGKL